MKKETIIDVRSVGEFMMGSVGGSKNIPLEEIESHLDNLKQLEGEIVVCCASGARSEYAKNLLLSAGVKNVTNGGSWYTLAN